MMFRHSELFDGVDSTFIHSEKRLIPTLMHSAGVNDLIQVVTSVCYASEIGVTQEVVHFVCIKVAAHDIVPEVASTGRSRNQLCDPAHHVSANNSANLRVIRDDIESNALVNLFAWAGLAKGVPVIVLVQQVLGDMAERSMPNVVEQRGKPHGLPVMVVKHRVQLAERVTRDPIENSVRNVHGSYYVLEPRVEGARVHQMGESKLPYTSKALEYARVDHGALEVRDQDESMDRVTEFVVETKRHRLHASADNIGDSRSQGSLRSLRSHCSTNDLSQSRDGTKSSLSGCALQPCRK
jgi:hypothetical protein